MTARPASDHGTELGGTLSQLWIEVAHTIAEIEAALAAHAAAARESQSLPQAAPGSKPGQGSA